jgi:hypothetical protein
MIRVLISLVMMRSGVITYTIPPQPVPLHAGDQTPRYGLEKLLRPQSGSPERLGEPQELFIAGSGRDKICRYTIAPIESDVKTKG